MDTSRVRSRVRTRTHGAVGRTEATASSDPIQNKRPSDTASSHLEPMSRPLVVGRDEVTRTNRGAEGIGGRVKFLPLAWAGMPKTSFRKNSDSSHYTI